MTGPRHERPPAAPPSKRARIQRDSIITAFALLGGTYEIVLGGGRVSVLTFLSGLLLSPAVLRFDEARRAARIARWWEERVPGNPPEAAP